MSMTGFLRVATKKSQHALLPVANILWLQGHGNYTMIHTIDGKSNISAYTIGSFFEQLPEGFYRIHKSFVISLQYIKSIRWQGKALVVTMADVNNTGLVVSRQRRKDFLSLLDVKPGGKRR